MTLIVSVAVESTQLMIGRVFDIDDILLNVVGGVLGHYCYILVLKIGQLCPKVFLSEWFLNLLSFFSPFRINISSLIGNFMLYCS